MDFVQVGAESSTPETLKPALEEMSDDEWNQFLAAKTDRRAAAAEALQQEQSKDGSAGNTGPIQAAIAEGVQQQAPPAAAQLTIGGGHPLAPGAEDDDQDEEMEAVAKIPRQQEAPSATA